MTGPDSGSGTVLPDPADMTSALQAALPQFRQVAWVAETNSTNGDLINRARWSVDDPGQTARPWLQGAHLQAQGRGRAGRTWQNRVGANLMFSCAFDVFLPARQLPTLAPLVGMVATQALRRHLADQHQSRLNMKWPNDLQWDQAKLAGILIESTRAGMAQVADHHLIIIGMGLNLLDARALSQSLNRRVADWAGIAAQDPVAARTRACDLVASAARAWYQALNDVTAHGFADLPTRYAQVDGLAGQVVDVIDNGRLRHTGVACGIDAAGQLLLRNDRGLQAASVGEISVRLHQ
ncbi:biotin--[acetyl-CoA-carboxylase] ligase [Castellaniella hirudinis]|uniref:biotin--[acetyl-CoA-carboxylase] ligase n=1 Tax=Castellaniella hirudinis TaxID=1144617 RepID=UPI0039C31DA4